MSRYMDNESIVSDKVPKTVGIIMDGNRRWAKAKGLPVFEGHNKGYETLKDVLKWSKALGVKNVIAFTFSLENWQRTQEEVSFLLGLIRRVVMSEVETFLKEKTRVRFAGDISRFPEDIQKAMRDMEEKTKEFDSNMNLVLCVSYGGRQEITMAVNRCIEEGITNITHKDISEHLYTSGIPDPDIIIRTSGEMRLSGFLLWQATYSEFFFTKTLWPDFGEEELKAIFAEYAARDRRVGK